MKKKFASISLALVMATICILPAFAAEVQENTIEKTTEINESKETFDLQPLDEDVIEINNSSILSIDKAFANSEENVTYGTAKESAYVIRTLTTYPYLRDVTTGEEGYIEELGIQQVGTGSFLVSLNVNNVSDIKEILEQNNFVLLGWVTRLEGTVVEGKYHELSYVECNMNGTDSQKLDISGRDNIPLEITYLMAAPNSTSYDMRIEGNVCYHNPTISKTQLFKNRFTGIVHYLDY
jgi:hypothetical protein